MFGYFEQLDNFLKSVPTDTVSGQMWTVYKVFCGADPVISGEGLAEGINGGVAKQLPCFGNGMIF